MATQNGRTAEDEAEHPYLNSLDQTIPLELFMMLGGLTRLRIVHG